MAITAAKRKALPTDKFALPSKRAYPIDTAARTRNAAARLEQNKGDLSEAEYAEAKKNIARASKRFGIKSEYARTADLGVGDVHVPSAGRFKAGKTPTTIAASDAAGGEPILCGIQLDRRAPDAEGVVRDSIFNPGTTARLKWVQFAKLGQWTGHPAGAFQLTTKEFGQICANFYATKNRLIPIDFSHVTELDPTSGSLPETGAPAQGWAVDLDNRGVEGLWGLVEWKPGVATKIDNGEFLFFSPAIRFNAKDRVTAANIGARMSSGAITNVPFIDGMQRIAASDAAASEVTVSMASRPMMVGKSHDFLAACRGCLRLDDAANADQMKAKLANLRGLYSDADDAHAMCQGVNLSEYTTALGSLMGAPVNTDIADLLDAVEEMIDSAMAQHVAEYHLDDEGDDGAAMTDGAAKTVTATDTKPADQGVNKEASMADAETIKLLADLQTEKSAWASEKTTLLTEKTTLGAERDGATAKVNKLELELQKATTSGETKDETIRTLTDKVTARETADRQGAVDEAFDTYKADQKLTEGHKKQMMAFLLSDGLEGSDGAKGLYPAFNGPEGLYPRVEPDKRHLLHRIAGAGDKTEMKVPLVDDPDAPTFSMSDVADQLIAHGWDVEQAQIEAERRFRAMTLKH